MRLKKSMAIQLGIFISGISILTLLGMHSISSLRLQSSQIIEKRILPFINDKIYPLLSQDMTGLIEKDIPKMDSIQESIKLILEADRDLHQALIAAKEYVAAQDEAIKKTSDKSNTENIDQAKNRMEKASAFFEQEDTKKLYQEFKTQFSLWKNKIRDIFESSTYNEKEILDSFNETRDLIDRIQGTMENFLKSEQQKLQIKKQKIFKTVDDSGNEKTAIEKNIIETNKKADFYFLSFILSGILC